MERMIGVSGYYPGSFFCYGLWKCGTCKCRWKHCAGSGRIRGIAREHHRGGAVGTNGEQITSEAVATPLSKRGYVAENWMELFGVEKLVMSRVYICPSRRAISRYCQFLRMMAIGDRYYANSADAIFTSALGGVIVPVGEGCHTLAIRHRGELLGWIECFRRAVNIR